MPDMMTAAQAAPQDANRRTIPRLSAAARARGITPRMFGVLACAIATPGLSAKEVTQRLSMQKSAVCYAICRLERLGLMQHRADPADLRRMCIRATPAGVALLRSIVASVIRPAAPPPAAADHLAALPAEASTPVMCC